MDYSPMKCQHCMNHEYNDGPGIGDDWAAFGPSDICKLMLGKCNAHVDALAAPPENCPITGTVPIGIIKPQYRATTILYKLFENLDWHDTFDGKNYDYACSGVDGDIVRQLAPDIAQVVALICPDDEDEVLKWARKK